MNILTAINVISNFTIFTSIFVFIISVFGRSDHPIWQLKYRAYLAKFGLCVSGCGALLNVLTLSTPNVTEVIQNVGLSLNFFWISMYQYSEWKKAKQKKAVKKPRVVRSRKA